jgi:two-component system response regulator AtoC
MNRPRSRKGANEMTIPKILIVEDEFIVARDLKKRLAQFGYEVAGTVASGEEAIIAAEERRPDLVLMDIMLEGNIDGIEAAKSIRDKLNIPVIYLTSHSDDVLLQRAKVTSPFGYLIKPFEVRELQATLEMALYKSDMERRLRESEHRFRTIFETVPVSIWEEDFAELKAAISELKSKGVADFRAYVEEHPEFLDQALKMIRVLDVNEATVNLYGAQSKEKLLGGLEHVLGKQELETFREVLVALAEGETHFEAETVGHNLKGDLMNYMLSVSMPEKTSAYKHALVSLKDVTDLKRAEQALQRAHDDLERRVRERTAELAAANEELRKEVAERREAERRLEEQHQFMQTVLESLTHPFYVVSAADYSVVMANSATGVPPSEGRIACHTIAHGLSRPCDTVDQPCPLQALKTIKKPVTVEQVHYDGEGRPKNVEVHAYPILDENGEVTQVIEYCIDVTERNQAIEALRESEERFRTLVDSANDCIFIKSTDGRYTLVNPAMASLLDMPAEKVLGKTDADIFGEEAGEYLLELDFRVARGERIEEEHTVDLHGVPMTLLTTRVPMRNAVGEVTGICGIAHNITDRKQIIPLPQPSDTKYKSEAIQRSLVAARRAAMGDSIILLTGESGAGKDYLAKYIHDNSRRSGGPFFSINCAAVAPELAESELFGHEAGAFTGAGRRKKGLLELAEGGTLLLNEIGELSLRLQAKLLAFLDTRSFNRVGGERSITVNARLIAATNRNLAKEVSERRFREDLFHRLNVFSLIVPPLRERPEDIPILVGEIIGQLAAELQMTQIPQLTMATMDKLCNYHWPGNVRELRNVLERSLILSEGATLRLDLPESFDSAVGDQVWSVPFPPEESLNHALKDLRRSMIQERCGGKRADAATMLGLTRDSLKRQMKTLGFFD